VTAPIHTLAAGELAGDAPSEGDARLMTHAYDGIREYDNPLPGWWRATFWATIAFAAAYGFYFHLSGWGTTTDARYQRQLTDYLAKRVFSGGGGAVVAATEQSLARDSQSDVILEQGKRVFAERCSGCHLADGRGQVGPNLTDGFQLHGTTRMDIINTVTHGVAGTAMVAWGEQLPASELNAVAAFAISLRGKNIAGKEPQGNPVGAFSAGP
jgi:cytochrome c oxidase cbb3-type subunit 3